MAHMTVGAGKSEICREASSQETLGRVHVASLSLEDCLEVEFLLPQGASVFFLKTFKRLDTAHSQYEGTDEERRETSFSITLVV